MKINCPDCKDEMKLDDFDISESDDFNCNGCGLELALVKRGTGYNVVIASEEFGDDDDDVIDDDDD
ncbi:MAG: hypothetical protein GOV15_01200 [Candidatus Diapherotrites archaeon]|nr:hypothetical protein [Candidatus Diapherotrites archaeon]